jgi:hypothetical protein
MSSIIWRHIWRHLNNGITLMNHLHDLKVIMYSVGIRMREKGIKLINLMYVCMRVFVCIFVCMCMCIHIYCMYSLPLSTTNFLESSHACVCMACMQVTHACRCTYMWTTTHLLERACVYACICKHEGTQYIRGSVRLRCGHTRIHTYIHTYTLRTQE